MIFALFHHYYLAPAEVASTIVPAAPKVPAITSSLGATTKLVHPEEDISLVRLNFTRYLLTRCTSLLILTFEIDLSITNVLLGWGYGILRCY